MKVEFIRVYRYMYFGQTLCLTRAPGNGGCTDTPLVSFGRNIQPAQGYRWFEDSGVSCAVAVRPRDLFHRCGRR